MVLSRLLSSSFALAYAVPRGTRQDSHLDAHNGVQFLGPWPIR